MNLNDLFLVTDKDTINYTNYSTEETKLVPQIASAEFKDYIPIEHDRDGNTNYAGLFEFLSNNSSESGIVWNKWLPAGESKTYHYNTFLYSLIQMSQQIYNNTKKVCGNDFIVSADTTPVFCFMDGFERNRDFNNLYGTYKYGAINSDGINANIYVSPELPSGEVICIAKTPDNMSASIAVSIKDDKWSAASLNKGMAVRGQVICREEG